MLQCFAKKYGWKNGFDFDKCILGIVSCRSLFSFLYPIILVKDGEWELGSDVAKNPNHFLAGLQFLIHVWLFDKLDAMVLCSDDTRIL